MTSAFLHATNPGMNRHTHSTSTPSTVRSLVTLWWQRGREGGAGGHLQTFSLLETDHNDVDYHTIFAVLFSLVKYISVSGGWGHLRNGSRSVALWLLWIRCCTTVSGLNWWQLRQTRKERFSCVNPQLVASLLACAWVFVCLDLVYLQLTAVVVSAGCVLQPWCVQAPWWSSQDKHKLLSTVRV